MTLDDLMSPLATDYPNANLTLRYDPFRTSCRWTATAYIWRSDGETPTEAIRELWATLAANTIRTVPVLREGWCSACVAPSRSWMPYTHREIANMRVGEHPPKLGPPPSHSIVYDGTAERLYIPERA